LGHISIPKKCLNENCLFRQYLRQTQILTRHRTLAG
jgi:hypothetical protein